MQRILVTGSDGLIGSAIKRLNLPNTTYLGHGNVDLTDKQATIDKFLELNPTHIIHCAAKVGGINGNMKHPGSYFYQNLLINANVLEAARIARVEKLLSFLSTCIFPDKAPYPLNEVNLHDGPPHPSNYGYAHAKRMIEVQSRAYRHEYGCNFIMGIPTNVYGPNDNFSLDDGHVLPSLIHRAYLASQNGTSLEVWGTGAPLREFVLSDDIAKLAVWALNSYNESAPIIFSSGIETSIKATVELIVQKIGLREKIIWNNSKPDGQMRKPSDDSKLKHLYPNFVFTLLSDGLDITIDWFKKNYPNIRK